MDNSVVDGVDAGPLVGGIIAFAYRHHFVLSTVLFFRILHFHCFWFRSARWVESLSPKRYENFFNEKKVSLRLNSQVFLGKVIVDVSSRRCFR